MSLEQFPICDTRGNFADTSIIIVNNNFLHKNVDLSTRYLIGIQFLVFTAKYYAYDNYFDLPGSLLCGRIVDGLDKVSSNQVWSIRFGVHE